MTGARRKKTTGNRDKGKSTPPKTPARKKPAPGALLRDAQDAWRRADCDALAALGKRSLARSPDRAELAVMIAAGLAQQGEHTGARKMAIKAKDWGCPPRQMAEVLISAALETAGRATCLLADTDAARPLFAEAVAVFSPDGDLPDTATNRLIQAQSALGLLPEARDVLETALSDMQQNQQLSSNEAVMFKSQLDLLTHTLSLAQMRGQLSAPAPTSKDVDAETRPADDQLAQRAVSQLGQDLWVLEQTGYKRGGFFVEFGATDGVILSNTLLLETEFDWDGILAEPNPAFFARLQQNRTCTLAPDCIMGKTGQEVSFILADEYGGVAEFGAEDAHVERRRAFQDANHVLTLPTISLDDFLRKYNAPHRIDYLSVDTEGSEYEILRHFPFDDWDIRLVTIEHNFTPIRDDIRALMERHGFACREEQWDDWYYKP